MKNNFMIQVFLVFILGLLSFTYIKGLDGDIIVEENNFYNLYDIELIYTFDNVFVENDISTLDDNLIFIELYSKKSIVYTNFIYYTVDKEIRPYDDVFAIVKDKLWIFLSGYSIKVYKVGVTNE